MTRKNLETLVEMFPHVQVESIEEGEAILDLYYHLRLAVEREEQRREEESRKREKKFEEAALKQETYDKLQSGAYTVGEMSEELGVRSEELTANEYQRLAMRTAATLKKRHERLENGLMGLYGEAGECIDLLKKYYFQGHELDEEKLAEELGDVAWYLALAADALGLTLGEIMQKNIDKLRKRYPEGFSAERSVNRDAES